MSVLLTEEVDVPFSFDYEEAAAKTVAAALSAEKFPYEAEVSVLLTGEKQIRELNFDTRGVNAATDVLSFPLLTYPRPADYSALSVNLDTVDPDSGEVMLGDIVLCVPRIIHQAEDYGHSILREYSFLICHSMLHLLGYDHMEEEERNRMESRQRVIMDKIGISR